jgi:hypothetical protein
LDFSQTGDIGYTGYYGVYDPAELCHCGDWVPPEQREHCLQSREYFSAAANEGFAHFFATKLFNNDQHAESIFVYYKPLRFGGDWIPPFAISGYIPVSFMEALCTPSSFSHSGVEWDWLTFFYNVTSRDRPNYTTIPDLYRIYSRACSGDPTTGCPCVPDPPPSPWCSDTRDPWWDKAPAPGEHYAMSVLAAAEAEFSAQGKPEKYARFRDTGDAHGVNH